MTKPDNLDTVASELVKYIRELSSPDAIQVVSGVKVNKPTDFSTYIGKPVEFARDILGLTMWERQAEIMRAVVNNRFVIVEAGHAVGKSVCAAVLGIYWLSIYEEAILVTSAPTMNQVNNLLWRYMRQYKSKAKAVIPGNIFQIPRWEVSPNCHGIGLSPKKNTEIDVASLQGYHSPNLLVILDEAAGLTIPLFNAAISLVAGENNRLLGIGNPVAKTGPFYDATQSQNFKSYRISCFDHPNVKQKKDTVPGAVSWQWVDERVKDWCRPATTESQRTFTWNGALYEPLPIFEARVLGKPPDEADNQLIPLSWVETAMLEQTEDPTGERVLGLDIARMGDDESALYFRIGDAGQWIERQRGNDDMQTSYWLIRKILDCNAEKVFVDITGGLGAGAVDYCNSQGLNVEGVNFSSAAYQRTKFSNMRHEMWWTIREGLRKGKITLPNDDKLAADLIAPMLEKPDAQGRIVVEDKDGIRKRLGRSPDSGDAVAVSYAGTMFDDDNVISGNYSDSLATTSIERDNLPTTSRWKVSSGRKSGSRWFVGR